MVQTQTPQIQPIRPLTIRIQTLQTQHSQQTRQTLPLTLLQIRQQTILIQTQAMSIKTIAIQTNTGSNLSSSNTVLINLTTNGSSLLEENVIFSNHFILILNLTVSNSFISRMISFPAIRKLFSSLFSYFINLDHLWFYIYHQRPIGNHFEKFLTQIHNLEEIKWNFISDPIFDFDPIEHQLQFKKASVPSSFYAVEQKSRQFFSYNIQLFMVNVPLTFVAFLVLKFLHQIFLKYGLQKVLQHFSHFSFLIVILFEGNSESFTQFLVSDMTKLFSYHFRLKIVNISSVFCLFTLILLLIDTPFILRFLFEKQKQIQFYDKCTNSLKGSIFFMIEFGLFNLVLGSIHLLIQTRPNFHFFCLFLAETSFVVYLTTNFRHNAKVYQSKFETFVMIWASFLRMNLIFSSYLFEVSYDTLADKVEEVQEAQIISYLILLMVSTFYLSIDQLTMLTKRLLRKMNIKIHLSLYSNQQLKAKTTTFEKKQEKDLQEDSVRRHKSLVPKENKEKRISFEGRRNRRFSGYKKSRFRKINQQRLIKQLQVIFEKGAKKSSLIIQNDLD